jgi:type II secretory pathway pseudopilin PulG
MTQMRRVAFMNRDVRSDGLAGTSGRSVRRGFTLVEVVVAAAILMILMVTLVGVFARGVVGFRNAQLDTLAQNLAEFQAEDLKSMAPTVLHLLVERSYPGALYELDASGNPVADPSFPGPGHYRLDSSNPLVEYSNYKYPADTAAQHDAYLANLTGYQYDSGYIDTEFDVVGITRIIGGMYVAGPASDPSAAPALDGEPPVLGANVAAIPYSDASVYWKYYRVALHKQAFPLFSKRIQVTYYNASDPTKNDHTWAGPEHAVFDYVITVYNTAGGNQRILYQTAGTVAAPYAVATPKLAVTTPDGLTVWTKGSEGNSVGWQLVQGDASLVYRYDVFLSADGTHWDATPVASALAPATGVLVTAPDADTSYAMARVVAYSSSGGVVAQADSEHFTVGTGSGGAGVGPVVVHITSPTSSVVSGTECTISWTTSGDAALRGIITRYQVTVVYDAGGSDSPGVTTWDGAGGSASWTPSVTGPCTITVTAIGTELVSTAGRVTVAVTTSSPMTLSVTPFVDVTDPTFMADAAQPGDTLEVSWSLSPAVPSGSTVAYKVQLYDGAALSSTLISSTPATPSRVTIPSNFCLSGAVTAASVKVTATVTSTSGSTTTAPGSSLPFKCVRPVTAAITATGNVVHGSQIRTSTTYWVQVLPADDASPVRWSALKLTIGGTTYDCAIVNGNWGCSWTTGGSNNVDVVLTATATVAGRGTVTLGSITYKVKNNP